MNNRPLSKLQSSDNLYAKIPSKNCLEQFLEDFSWQPCTITTIPTTLLKDQAHIYLVNLDTIVIDTTVLNSEERARTEKMRFSLHRQRSQNARAVLRYLLSKYTQIAAEKLVFNTGKYGKLYLHDQAIQFNLAHANEYALYALSLNSAIGIDIEEQRNVDYNAIAQRIMSINEYEYWIKYPQPQQAELFFQIWTRKEALVKCTGDGLSASLKNLNTLVDSYRLPMRVVYDTNQSLWLSNLPSLAKIIKNRNFYAAAASAEPVAYHYYRLQD